MKKNSTKVEKTLKSWDDIERFEANPFLYTRIEQKIKNSQISIVPVWQWIWQPTLVVVLIVFNCFTIATAFSNNNQKTVYETIASEYNLSVKDNSTINY